MPDCSSKRSRDVKQPVDEATAEALKVDPDAGKYPAAVALGRKGGSSRDRSAGTEHQLSQGPRLDQRPTYHNPTATTTQVATRKTSIRTRSRRLSSTGGGTFMVSGGGSSPGDPKPRCGRAPLLPAGATRLPSRFGVERVDQPPSETNPRLSSPKARRRRYSASEESATERRRRHLGPPPPVPFNFPPNGPAAPRDPIP
jgi:hypothetical protein